MAFLEKKPDEFKPGATKLSAEALNQILRGSSREIRGNKYTTIQDYGDRKLISTDPRVAQSFVPDIRNYICAFVVTSEDKDFLRCVPFIPPIDSNSGTYIPLPYSDTTGSNSNLPFVWIAKPYQLQQTPWAGKNVTLNGDKILLDFTGIGDRIAKDTLGNLEFQIITPPYIPGEVIMAVPFPTGYRKGGKNNEFTIVWMDLNIAGRAWALKPFFNQIDF